ncbi:MAG: hypothetical protein HC902_03540 [Calothrix sp. SM1_5_4]|nr:hypothetical protein [Calothrix sp. SM1_5_4]
MKQVETAAGAAAAKTTDPRIKTGSADWYKKNSQGSARPTATNRAAPVSTSAYATTPSGGRTGARTNGFTATGGVNAGLGGQFDAPMADTSRMLADTPPPPERKSELPNLGRLPTASDGGGGGATAPSAASDQDQINLADYLPNGRLYAPARSPTGMDRRQPDIQTKSADIWQLISNRFRIRCKQDLLYDCSKHLPP